MFSLTALKIEKAREVEKDKLQQQNVNSGSVVCSRYSQSGFASLCNLLITSNVNVAMEEKQTISSGS